MADDWEAQLDLKGGEWGVSEGKIAEFKSRKAAAAAMLAEVKSGGRTKVNTKQCRLLFHELALTMHFLKNNFFNAPPRANDELVALLLSVHDGTPPPIALCDVVPGLSPHNTDGHGMLVKLFRDAEPADGRPLTRHPARADDLPQHFSTGRRSNTLPFNPADIGMEFFASACRQTPRNQDGPYCPIVSRLIA
jgi:hypothetical protein